MPKEIRFTELVKNCGKPKTVTLWGKPEDDPSLKKAIAGNRVLTVNQKAGGGHKDFGNIGFHPAPFSLYLVFPKRLPKSPQSRVIGIKYDLVEQPKPVKPAVAEKPARPGIIVRNKPEPPALRKFLVTVLRQANVETRVTVNAINMSAAESAGLDAVKREVFKPSEVRNEVKSIAEA